jgi:hypothetical protein
MVPLDGTRTLLFGGSIPESPVEGMGYPLAVFGLEWLAIAVVGAGVVWWRYRRVAA